MSAIPPLKVEWREVLGVAGHQHLPLVSGILKLGLIGQFGIPHLPSADGIVTSGAQLFSYPIADVMVKIELHPLLRPVTHARASSLAAISASISDLCS